VTYKQFSDLIVNFYCTCESNLLMDPLRNGAIFRLDPKALARLGTPSPAQRTPPPRPPVVASSGDVNSEIKAKFNELYRSTPNPLSALMSSPPARYPGIFSPPIHNHSHMQSPSISASPDIHYPVREVHSSHIQTSNPIDKNARTSKVSPAVEPGRQQQQSNRTTPSDFSESAHGVCESVSQPMHDKPSSSESSVLHSDDVEANVYSNGKQHALSCRQSAITSSVVDSTDDIAVSSVTPAKKETKKRRKSSSNVIQRTPINRSTRREVHSAPPVKSRATLQLSAQQNTEPSTPTDSCGNRNLLNTSVMHRQVQSEVKARLSRPERVSRGRTQKTADSLVMLNQNHIKTEVNTQSLSKEVKKVESSTKNIQSPSSKLKVSESINGSSSKSSKSTLRKSKRGPVTEEENIMGGEEVHSEHRQPSKPSTEDPRSSSNGKKRRRFASSDTVLEETVNRKKIKDIEGPDKLKVSDSNVKKRRTDRKASSQSSKRKSVKSQMESAPAPGERISNEVVAPLVAPATTSGRRAARHTNGLLSLGAPDCNDKISQRTRSRMLEAKEEVEPAVECASVIESTQNDSISQQAPVKSAGKKGKKTTTIRKVSDGGTKNQDLKKNRAKPVVGDDDTGPSVATVKEISSKHSTDSRKWNAQEIKALKQAHRQCPVSAPDFWTQVATTMTRLMTGSVAEYSGRSETECQEQWFKALEEKQQKEKKRIKPNTMSKSVISSKVQDDDGSVPPPKKKRMTRAEMQHLLQEAFVSDADDIFDSADLRRNSAADSPDPTVNKSCLISLSSPRDLDEHSEDDDSAKQSSTTAARSKSSKSRWQANYVNKMKKRVVPKIASQSAGKYSKSKGNKMHSLIHSEDTDLNLDTGRSTVNIKARVSTSGRVCVSLKPEDSDEDIEEYLNRSDGDSDDNSSS